MDTAQILSEVDEPNYEDIEEQQEPSEEYKAGPTIAIQEEQWEATQESNRLLEKNMIKLQNKLSLDKLKKLEQIEDEIQGYFDQTTKTITTYQGPEVPRNLGPEATYSKRTDRLVPALGLGSCSLNNLTSSR